MHLCVGSTQKRFPGYRNTQVHLVRSQKCSALCFCNTAVVVAVPVWLKLPKGASYRASHLRVQIPAARPALVSLNRAYKTLFLRHFYLPSATNSRSSSQALNLFTTTYLDLLTERRGPRTNCKFQHPRGRRPDGRQSKMMRFRYHRPVPNSMWTTRYFTEPCFTIKPEETNDKLMWSIGC